MKGFPLYTRSNKLKVKKLLYTLITIIIVIMMACSGNESNTNEAVSDNSPKQDSSINNSNKKAIIFYGNSLTAGYGLDPAHSFPAVIGRKIDSLQLPYKVVNAGVSGETSSGGLGRIDWILQQPIDVFVLELGANDGLRGIPLTETKKNLQEIINRVRKKYPSAKIVLAGLLIPPNMGPDYTNEFRTIFPDLAKTNSVALIPFLLEGVGGEPSLNLGDGIHPTEEGHKIVAENVWKILEAQLEK